MNPGKWISRWLTAGEQKILLVTLLLAFLSSAGCFLLVTLEGHPQISKLPRPAAGAEEMTEKMEISVEGTTREVTLHVPSRTYTEEETQQILEEALQRIPEEILGDNASAEQIRSPLQLKELCQDLPVKIRWKISQPGCLKYDGSLGEDIPEEGQEVELKATVTCQEEVRYLTLSVTVYPEQEEEKDFETLLQEQLEALNADTTGSWYLLPDQVDGKSVRWQEKQENPWLIILLLVLAGGALLISAGREQEKKRAQKRQEILSNRYPAFASRLVLQLQAGMSIRTILFRMTEEKLSSEKISPLEEELRQICYELQQGVPEEQALKNFGERVRLPAYRNLATMLIQLQKRGGRDTLNMLQLESEKAFQERQRNAQIRGSEISLKLLMPMMLMFVIILILLLFPAMVSL